MSDNMETEAQGNDPGHSDSKFKETIQENILCLVTEALKLAGHPNILNDWTKRTRKFDIRASAAKAPFQGMQYDDAKDDDDPFLQEMKTKLEAATTPEGKMNVLTYYH